MQLLRIRYSKAYLLLFVLASACVGAWISSGQFWGQQIPAEDPAQFDESQIDFDQGEHRVSHSVQNARNFDSSIDLLTSQFRVDKKFQAPSFIIHKMPSGKVYKLKLVRIHPSIGPPKPPFAERVTG